MHYPDDVAPATHTVLENGRWQHPNFHTHGFAARYPMLGHTYGKPPAGASGAAATGVAPEGAATGAATGEAGAAGAATPTTGADTGKATTPKTSAKPVAPAAPAAGS